MDKEEHNQSVQKAKMEQLLKIDTLMKGYYGVIIGKKQLDELWKKLTVELNAIGPPTFTSIEWQQIWSDYKDNLIPGRASRKCQLTHSTTIEDIPTQVDLNSIRVIAEKQDVIIEQQNFLIKLHMTTNKLLEEIIKRRDMCPILYENRLDNQLHTLHDGDGLSTSTKKPSNASITSKSSIKKLPSSEASESYDDFYSLSHSLNVSGTLENGNRHQTDKHKEAITLESGASTFFENEYECNLLTCSTTYHEKFRAPSDRTINWIDSMDSFSKKKFVNKKCNKLKL